MESKMIDQAYGFDAYGSYVIDQYWQVGGPDGLLMVSVRVQQNDEYAAHAMATFLDTDTGKLTDITFHEPLSRWHTEARHAMPSQNDPDPVPTEPYTTVIRHLVDRAANIVAVYL